MAKLSVSVEVPLPPEKAWDCASDLSRYKEWLSIHRVLRSPLPQTLDKGTVVESIVEVKGMPNRVKWTIVRFKPPEAMTLDGAGKGGAKGKLIGPIGMIVAGALKGDIRESLRKFKRVFAGT